MDPSITVFIVTAFGIVFLVAFHFIRKAFVPKLRAELQQALNEKQSVSDSLKQFKKLFEEAPIPYFILNNKAQIKELNKAGLRFFGVTPEEILTVDLFMLVAPEDVQYAGYLLTSCIRNIPINNKEIRMVSKKGDVRWVLISILPIEQLEHESSSSLATLLDITDQKNLDNAKTEFVSLASHQLRAPLATVKWYSEMLLSAKAGELTPKQKEYVKVMSEVNTDMIDLVDTLLNVSRMEIGKLSVEVTPTNVQTLTESILTELSPQIEKKKMEIIKQYGGIFTSVNTDPHLLRIIIHNLITNAIKYTPEQGKITISFRIDEGKNRITVTDTGYGIPKDQQSKIFTKLFRADNIKDISSSQSTGLGLYLVQSLMKAMGGDISFQSEVNKGTSFTITF